MDSLHATNQGVFSLHPSQKPKSSKECEVTSFVLNILQALVIWGSLTVGIMGARGYLPKCTSYIGFITFAISSVVIGGYQVYKRRLFPLNTAHRSAPPSGSPSTQPSRPHYSLQPISQPQSLPLSAPYYSSQPVGHSQQVPQTSISPIRPSQLSISENELQGMIYRAFRKGKREVKEGELKGLWYGPMGLYKEILSTQQKQFKGYFQAGGILPSKYFNKIAPFTWNLDRKESASEAIEAALSGFTHVDCTATATIIYYYSILSELLGKEKFDLLFGSPSGSQPLLGPLSISKSLGNLALFFVDCTITDMGNRPGYFVDGQEVHIQNPEDWDVAGRGVWNEIGDWNFYRAYENQITGSSRKEKRFDFIYLNYRPAKNNKKDNFYVGIDLEEPTHMFDLIGLYGSLACKKFNDDPNWISFDFNNHTHGNANEFRRLNFPFIENLRRASLSEFPSLIQAQRQLEARNA